MEGCIVYNRGEPEKEDRGVKPPLTSLREEEVEEDEEVEVDKEKEVVVIRRPQPENFPLQKKDRVLCKERGYVMQTADK